MWVKAYCRRRQAKSQRSAISENEVMRNQKLTATLVGEAVLFTAYERLEAELRNGIRSGPDLELPRTGEHWRAVTVG